MAKAPVTNSDDERLLFDLIKKATADVKNTLDRNIALVPAEDDELRAYIICSILASVATSCVSYYVDFLNDISGYPENIPPKQFQERLQNSLVSIGRVILEGHARRNQTTKPH